MTELVRYEAGRRALAEATRVDEVKDIRDKAVAVHVYAQQAMDRELIERATEIRKRAEIRAGELLREIGERRGGDQTTSERSLPTNKEMGITDNQSSQWQRMAALPTNEQEALIERAKKTAAAAIERPTTEEKRDPAALRRRPRQYEQPESFGICHGAVGRRQLGLTAAGTAVEAPSNESRIAA
jgi:hypothetical protein